MSQAFTFQSGDIQIQHQQQILMKFQYNLHSNLVIFKLSVPALPKILRYKFTFQSGDIQMLWRKKKKLLKKQIYIPIW